MEIVLHVPACTGTVHVKVFFQFSIQTADCEGRGFDGCEAVKYHENCDDCPYQAKCLRTFPLDILQYRTFSGLTCFVPAFLRYLAVASQIEQVFVTIIYSYSKTDEEIVYSELKK